MTRSPPPNSTPNCYRCYSRRYKTKTKPPQPEQAIKEHITGQAAVEETARQLDENAEAIEVFGLKDTPDREIERLHPNHLKLAADKEAKGKEAYDETRRELTPERIGEIKADVETQRLKASVNTLCAMARGKALPGVRHIWFSAPTDGNVELRQGNPPPDGDRPVWLKGINLVVDVDKLNTPTLQRWLKYIKQLKQAGGTEAAQTTMAIMGLVAESVMYGTPLDVESPRERGGLIV